MKRITADHERFLAALQRLEVIAASIEARPPGDLRSAEEAREAGGLLSRLLIRLSEHEEAEHRSLFPAVRQRVPGSGRLLDDLEEAHGQIERRIIDARALLPTKARHSAYRLAAALKPFIKDLRDHILREERDLLPLARTGFTPQDLETLEQREEAAEFPEFVDVGGGD